jgi:hypothetical protein
MFESKIKIKIKRSQPAAAPTGSSRKLANPQIDARHVGLFKGGLS